jgi:hypothetical protein
LSLTGGGLRSSVVIGPIWTVFFLLTRMNRRAATA